MNLKPKKLKIYHLKVPPKEFRDCSEATVVEDLKMYQLLPDLDNDMIQPDDVSDDVPDDNGLDPDYSPPNDHDNDMIQLDDVSNDIPDDSDIDPGNSPPNNQTEVDPDEVIPLTVSTTTSYVHQIFSDAQIGTVLKQCNVIIKSGPISDTRIKCALKQSKEGKELLENFTLTQIKNRVKYERRKLKR